MSPSEKDATVSGFSFSFEVFGVTEQQASEAFDAAAEVVHEMISETLGLGPKPITEDDSPVPNYQPPAPPPSNPPIKRPR